MAASRVLVIDVGGTNVKLRVTGATEPTKIPSGSGLTPQAMVDEVLQAAADLEFDVISIGYPGQVVDSAIAVEPKNLGRGWVDFDFEGALGKPVKLLNDAAMQALGSYQGDEMLFLGLGTGLGSALIVKGTLQPLEIGHLPYRKGRTYEDYLGKRGLERLGKKKWRKHVTRVVEALHEAFQVDYVVLGGGNANRLAALPPHARPGSNELAFIGGLRMWDPDRGVRI